MRKVILAVQVDKDKHFYKNINTYLLFTGFDKAQAETIVSALTTLSNISLDSIYKEMVTRTQQVIISLLSFLTVSLDSLFYTASLTTHPPPEHTYIFLILYKGTREQEAKLFGEVSI